MNFIDFSDFNFAPFIIFIILGAILVIVIEKIGSSAISNMSSGGGGHHLGGSGNNKDVVENITQFVADSASGARRKQYQREESQRKLIRQIKITGLIAGFAFIIAVSSIFSFLGAKNKITENDISPIIIPVSGLIMGTIITIAFSIRFIQLKRSYELYYSSIFGKKR